MHVVLVLWERFPTNVILFNHVLFFFLGGATLCNPCQTGQYSNHTGAITCNDCPSGRYCSVGTSTPLPLFFQNITSASLTRDPFFLEQSNENAAKATESMIARLTTISTVVVLAALILLALVLLLVLLRIFHKRSRILGLLAKIDMFTMKHLVKLNESPVNHATTIGGFVSIGFIFAVLAIIALFLIDLVNNNIIMRSTIIPENVVPADYPPIVQGSYSILVRLHNYNDPTCAPSQQLINGFEPKEQLLINSTKHANATCDLKLVCMKCKLTGVTQELQFMWNYPFAMASSIEYTILLPHFKNQEQFQVYELIIPETREVVFRGNQPTEASLSLLKSYYTPLAKDYLIGGIITRTSAADLTRVGYVATKFPTRYGSVSQDRDFVSSQQGLGITIRFTLNANVFMIEEEAKSSILEFVSKVVALIGAIEAVAAIIMNKIEEFQDCIQQRRQSTVKKNEIDAIEMPDTIMEQNNENTGVKLEHEAQAQAETENIVNQGEE